MNESTSMERDKFGLLGETKFVVQFNGHPVQFIRRHAGIVFSICPLEDATKFDSFIEAADTVVFSDIIGHKAEITINPVRGELVAA